MIIISRVPSNLVERMSDRTASSSITVPKFLILPPLPIEHSGPFPTLWSKDEAVRLSSRGEKPCDRDIRSYSESTSGVPAYIACFGVDAMNMRCFNPQFFIASKVGDEALERDEARRARKFDHDLGIVIDALRVLWAAVPADHVFGGDRLALDRLEELGREVNSARARDENGHSALSTADVDDLIRKLRQLRREDPQSADDVLRRLAEEAGPTTAETVTG